MANHLTVRTVVHTPADDPALRMVANCYTLGAPEPAGLTLVAAHGVGFHKEQWEPIFERVFLQQQHKPPRRRVREAWAFDWQSHGESAVLNEDTLRARPPGAISSFQWAPAISAFIKARLAGHRLVGIGHSGGAGTLMLTTRDFRRAADAYAALVLVEPTMCTRELFDAHFAERTAATRAAVALTAAKRDTWPDRAEAHRWLRARAPWQHWDPRVLALFVDHGLRARPRGAGVALKCPRDVEAATYPDCWPHFEATRQWAALGGALPVHLVWGARADFVPHYARRALEDGSAGCVPASVTTVPGAGHGVVQQKPDLVGLAVSRVLDALDGNAAVTQKL